jgi:hypothetical protein
LFEAGFLAFLYCVLRLVKVMGFYSDARQTTADYEAVPELEKI